MSCLHSVHGNSLPPVGGTVPLLQMELSLLGEFVPHLDSVSVSEKPAVRLDGVISGGHLGVGSYVIWFTRHLGTSRVSGRSGL